MRRKNAKFLFGTAALSCELKSKIAQKIRRAAAEELATVRQRASAWNSQTSHSEFDLVKNRHAGVLEGGTRDNFKNLIYGKCV